MPERSLASLRYLRKKFIAPEDKDVFKNNFHISSSDKALISGFCITDIIFLVAYFLEA